MRIEACGGKGIAVRCDHTQDSETQGLIDQIRSEQGRLDRDDDKYLGNLYYDLAKNALTRMAYGLSVELKPDKIAVLAVSPGWMRTELVLRSLNTDEEHWQEVDELKRTESPYYIGRAIAALAGDPKLMDKSGQVLLVGDLAKEYRFTDIDGRYIPPFKATYTDMH